MCLTGAITVWTFFVGKNQAGLSELSGRSVREDRVADTCVVPDVESLSPGDLHPEGKFGAQEKGVTGKRGQAAEIDVWNRNIK
jgi:hypothetical protein